MSVYPSAPPRPDFDKASAEALEELLVAFPLLPYRTLPARGSNPQVVHHAHTVCSRATTDLQEEHFSFLNVNIVLCYECLDTEKDEYEKLTPLRNVLSAWSQLQNPLSPSSPLFSFGVAVGILEALYAAEQSPIPEGYGPNSSAVKKLTRTLLPAVEEFVQESLSAVRFAEIVEEFSAASTYALLNIAEYLQRIPYVSSLPANVATVQLSKIRTFSCGGLWVVAAPESYLVGALGIGEEFFLKGPLTFSPEVAETTVIMMQDGLSIMEAFNVASAF